MDFPEPVVPTIPTISPASMVRFISEKLNFQLDNALKRIAQMRLESAMKNVLYMQQCVNMELSTFSVKRLRKQIILKSVKNIG